MAKYRVSAKRKELYRYTITLHDIYEKLNLDIDKKKYLSIMNTFLENLSDSIVKERKYYDLPYKLGRLRIKKIKPRKFNKLNPALTLQYEKPIYYTNMHSFGNYFRWYWDKTMMIIRNKTYYSLSMIKNHKVKLSDEIFRCSKDPYLKDYDALS